ncbi:MAG: hypothetical protein ACLS9A_09245 [Clostridia bacterium]
MPKFKKLQDLIDKLMKFGNTYRLPVIRAFNKRKRRKRFEDANKERESKCFC